jgi:hypothetical protein
MSQHDLDTIEISIEHAKKDVTMLRAMERLTSNRDFKKIMLEGYFEKEASRLVLLRSAPSLQSEEDQAAILKAIDAIGEVRQYFSRIMQLGHQMEKQIADLEETREEILQEGVEV